MTLTEKSGHLVWCALVALALASKLDYLWRSCTGELSEQNDREWSSRYAVALNAGVNGICLSRTNLDVAFDDKGRQINPLIVRLTGTAGLEPLLRKIILTPRSGRSVYPQGAMSGVSCDSVH